MHRFPVLPARTPARCALSMALALLLALSALAPAAFAPPAFGEPAADAIDPPQQLTADAVSPDQIRLNGVAPADAENCQVYRSTFETGGYVLVGTVPGSEAQYLDTGLSPDTTYYYRLNATGGGQTSDWSNTAHATTPAQLFPLTYHRNYEAGDAVTAPGGTFSPFQSLALSSIASVGTSGADWSRIGYLFMGWNTDASARWGFMDYTMPVGPSSLYAIWAAMYSVEYDGNGADGGTVPVDPQTYAEGDAVPVASGEPTKAGYAFGGWTNEADGTVYHAGETFPMPAGGARLVARWVPQADAHKNELVLENDNLYEGDTLSFLATGHRQDEVGAVDGETRYIPVTWSIAPSLQGDFPDASPYRSTAALEAAGSYTLTATYAQKVYTAGAGWQRTGSVETLSRDFTVRARPVDPVDPVDPAHPSDPSKPVQPASAATGARKAIYSASKSLPRTADAVSLATLGTLACLVTLGAAGAVAARRKLR